MKTINRAQLRGKPLDFLCKRTDCGGGIVRLIDPKNISAKRYKNACDDFECGWNACINEIMECVQQIEAEPVRHGQWEEVWDYNYMQYFHQCSECGRDALTKEETMHDEVLSFYCPYCGAKMGKKEDAK